MARSAVHFVLFFLVFFLNSFRGSVVSCYASPASDKRRRIRFSTFQFVCFFRIAVVERVCVFFILLLFFFSLSLKKKPTWQKTSASVPITPAAPI